MFQPRIPTGQRLYVIGDIHGRFDLLDLTLDRIDADCAGRKPAQTKLIFLGDYVDRGPNSGGVIHRLIESKDYYDMVCLKGNHESLMAAFLRDPWVLSKWNAVGGLTTLMSYGLSPVADPKPSQCEVLSRKLRTLMPNSHHDFLDQLVMSYTCGDYVFVHAGVRPNVALDDQTERDLLWIRDEFTRYDGPHEKFVVHGHTPVIIPDVRPNRINIDTGAYATGRLTCLVLEGTNRRFLS